MARPKITVLQHSSVVRPYALFQHFEKLQIEVSICSFVPSLLERGWVEPTGEGPLLLLGGPQSVYEELGQAWMQKELAYVQKCLDLSAPAFGICLGGQILSHFLGAEVKKSPEPEVGWYPIKIAANAAHLGLEESTQEFFQWHYDAFGTPQDAKILFEGSSTNFDQGYLWKDQILSVQFHPEMTPEGAHLLCEKYHVPDGTQLHKTVCRKTDFANHGVKAQVVLEKMLTWFLQQK